MEAWDVEGVWGLSPCLLANVHAGTDPWAKAFGQGSVNFRPNNRGTLRFPDYSIIEQTGTDPLAKALSRRSLSLINFRPRNRRGDS